MSFDEIFDLTAGVYFNFYNIYILLIAKKGLSNDDVEVARRTVFQEVRPWELASKPAISSKKGWEGYR